MMLSTENQQRWSRFRRAIREPAAEFLGVMLIVIFGCGSNCQVLLSSNPAVASSQQGSYLSTNFGMAIGVSTGVWVAGGVSGGHINPAITLAFATWRKFPWRKVPIYIFSQLMGGIVGAALVFANYYHAIDAFEGGQGVRTLTTAGAFATYALGYMTNVSCFFSEVLGTAMLLIALFAITDKHNGPLTPGIVPVGLFLVVLGVGVALGMETSYSINPARDLGPRILTSMAGWGSAVYSYRRQYWLWCGVIGPIIGGQLGAAVYELFIRTGEDASSSLTKSAIGKDRDLTEAMADYTPV